MRRVEWAESARDDLRDTIAYIAADNPQAARHVAERIFETVDLLAAMPVGRPAGSKKPTKSPCWAGCTSSPTTWARKR